MNLLAESRLKYTSMLRVLMYQHYLLHQQCLQKLSVVNSVSGTVGELCCSCCIAVSKSEYRLVTANSSSEGLKLKEA